MRNIAIVLAVFIGGCANEVQTRLASEPGADDDDVAVVFDGDPAHLYDEDGEGPVEVARIPFVRLGVRFTSRDAGAFEVRTSADGEAWSAWTAPTFVFGEADAYAGHVDVPDGELGAYFQHRVIDEREPPTFVVLEPIGAVGDALTFAEDRDGSESGESGAIDASADSTASEGLNVSIQSRSSWGARAPNCKSFTGVRKATIHHTDGANDDDTAVPVTLRQIQAFHMFTRGWCDVGYNFLVSRDGRIWEGRGYGVMGAHTENANTDNMGISFLGNYMNVAPPLAQQVAAAKTLRYLHDRAGIPLTRSGDNGVKGHRQRGTTSTSCPGDVLYAKLGSIVTRAINKDFDQGPCASHHFDGAFCDDENSSGEQSHNRLKNGLDVDFHCANKDGSPAFCPGTKATRKDAIFVLGAAADMPTAGHPDAFPDDDGKREAWFNAAHAFGIIQGLNGRAEPDRKVSRSSLAVILSRMYALPPADRDYFDDDQDSSNEAAHNKVAAAGLFSGFSDANGGRRDFRGSETATRDTLAVVALRVFDHHLVPVWKLPEGCRTGAFAGTFCDDDGAGGNEAAHELLVARGVSLPCDPVAGRAAFCGGKEVNRDVLVYALTQVEGVPLAGHPDAFNDDDTRAHEAWFDAAKVFGVVTGYNGGTEMRPTQPANRDSLAMVLARIYDLPASNVDAFTDDDGTSSEPWHNKVAAAGLMLGNNDGHGGRVFNGAQVTTRDQVATVAKRAVDAGLVATWNR